VDVPGKVVEGTGGLLAVRSIRLSWRNGEPNCSKDNRLIIEIDNYNVGGMPIGNDINGLPVRYMVTFKDDPERLTEWTRGKSTAWVLLYLVTGKTCTILHRLSDAEYIGRQLYDVVPEALRLTDTDARRAAIPTGVETWVQTTAKLLNHGVPRALIATCKEYLERGRSGE
jgi:hypothetical protein